MGPRPNPHAETGPGPEIETARLSLARLCAADAEALYGYRSRPEVCRYQSWEPRTLAEVVAFIESLRAVPFGSPGTWFQLGIRWRETGALIGDLGVHFLDDGAQVEIGFTVAPDAQGKGVGTDAVTGLLDYLFGPLGKHRAFASADPRNERSLRLLQRLGLRQEAHFVKSICFKGEWADDVVFAILASEWHERRFGA